MLFATTSFSANAHIPINRYINKQNCCNKNPQEIHKQTFHPQHVTGVVYGLKAWIYPKVFENKMAKRLWRTQLHVANDFLWQGLIDMYLDDVFSTRQVRHAIQPIKQRLEWNKSSNTTSFKNLWWQLMPRLHHLKLLDNSLWWHMKSIPVWYMPTNHKLSTNFDMLFMRLNHTYAQMSLLSFLNLSVLLDLKKKPLQLQAKQWVYSVTDSIDCFKSKSY